jgi:hypothetical protein
MHYSERPTRTLGACTPLAAGEASCACRDENAQWKGRAEAEMWTVCTSNMSLVPIMFHSKGKKSTGSTGLSATMDQLGGDAEPRVNSMKQSLEIRPGTKKEI